MDLKQLRSSLSGAVASPDDSDFASAALGHTGPSTPDLVVKATTVDDVVAAVRFATDAGIPVVPRGGGHSVWYTVPGGLLLDLSALDEVTVDGTLISIGGGATWGRVARAAAEHGLAISAGDTASVGVGGNTLGGGIGWMVRLWGLALDQLEAAEVVTADGRVVRASARENPDLFWGLRGGGGNFGVVTRFEFRAHSLAGVLFGAIPVDDSDLRATLSAWREVMRNAPRELNVTFMFVPAMDPNAPSGANLVVCWAGGESPRARAAIAPLFDLPGVLGGEVTAMAYADILLDMPPVELPAEAAPIVVDGNAFVHELTDEVIDAAVTAHESATGMLMVRYLRGAFTDVPTDATALAWRDAEAFLVRAAFAAPGSTSAQVDDIRDAWQPVVDRGVGAYGNFTGSTDPSFVARMYPPETYARLQSLKRAWDPGNLFARNHNVVLS
jgi:FAD/FMN-containing dehydrogenase